jgi:hypothetical protein
MLRASSKTTLPFFGLILLSFSLIGCAEEPDVEVRESIVSAARLPLERGTVISTTYDDSAAPVHIQIKTCKSVTPSSTNEVDCRVDPEFAVVGGGATPASTTGKTFISESRPVDGRIWRGASKDLLGQAHEITVYAIGLRLDGVNTQVLRNSIEWKSSETTNGAAVLSANSDAFLVGGGASTQANPEGMGLRLLTESIRYGNSGWGAASASVNGTLEGHTDVALLQLDKKVIEGFGELEVRYKTGRPLSTKGGYHAASVSIDPGWALMGMGASAKTAAGASPRMLASIAPCTDGRCVMVATGDQTGISAGTTVPFAIQIRKMPGTHGLCNPGFAVTAGQDSCVASICQQKGECCTSNWDNSCVAMVSSTCGRSCREHTCVPTVYEPERWVEEDGNPVFSQCYYYARNKYPDGANMDPGGSLKMDPDEFKMSRLIAFSLGDGLVQTTFDGECPSYMTKVFLGAYDSWYGGYHWLRKDESGLWSDKFGLGGYALLTEDNGSHPYHNVQSHTYEAYFCSCNQPLPASQ